MKTNTDTQELEHIPTRMLKAELERRDNGRTYADVYERCGVRDEHRHLFDEVVYAICTEDMTITEVSTPERAGFIHGNAKNWVRNAGNLRGFRKLCGSHEPTPVTSVPTETVKTPIPQMVKDYLRRCAEAKPFKGFCSDVFLEEVFTHKGVDYGHIRAGTKHYFVGDRQGKGVPQRVKHTTRAYRNLDKATKGHRMKVDEVVYKHG